MEDDLLLKLVKAVENKKYLDNQIFKSINDTFFHTDCYELLNLVLKYLQNYPQQISLLQQRLFCQLLTKEQLHPLVFFLASRNDNVKYDLDFYLDNLPVEKWAYLMSAFYQRCPLIIFDPVFVMNIKTNINTYKMLVDSPQWFNENGDFFIGLHAIEFDENECNKLFTKLKTDWSTFKITKAAVSFVDLVASKCNKELEFIEFLITTLFSLSPENDDVTWLSNQIINNFKLLEPNCVIEISDWEDLTVKAVKYGLKEENPAYGFIRVFRRLIKKAVIDKSIISKSFELLAGHSQFSTIMLSREANQSQKEEVLRLIETLVKNEPSIMALSHVPLFLCSYNASLSVNDQLLLRILFHYEANGVPMSNYRPYLWGSFAISHYQVKNHLTSKTLNSYPSTTEILSYIPLKRLKETISCFPIDRTLHIKNQKIMHYGIHDSKDPSQMFDPAFFLPMISSLLATEAPLSIEKFNSNGCLSFVLACLGSCDSAIRTAAYHVLTLLRSHLFCRRAENMFWDYFISWVAHGIQDLHLTPPPQLPMIQALFLSKIVLAIANHEKGVKSTCCKILLVRPAARLYHIPELKTFLTSFTGLKDKSIHMRWFFDIIRDGTRSKKDWQVLKNMDILNIFIVLFSCSNIKDRILILKIMKIVFCTEPATNGGTGPWALSLMVAVSKYSNELSAEEIILVFKCLQSLSGSSFINIPAIDFWLSIFLEYGNNPDICSEGFVTLKNLISKFKKITFTENDLKDILCCAENSKVLSDDEIFKCRSTLEYGFHGMKIEDKLNSYLFLPSLVTILKAK